MNIEDAKSAKSEGKALGWFNLLLRLFLAFFAYCTAAHIFSPVRPMSSMLTTAGRALSVVTVYIGMFTFVYLFVAVCLLIILRVFRKARCHITNALAKAIIPSLFIGALLIFGGWYGTAHGDELSATTRKDLKDGIKRTCIKTQKSDPTNSHFPLWKIQEYCDCSAVAISRKITPEEIDFFQINNTWPKASMERNREEGFKCMELLTKKWNKM